MQSWISKGKVKVTLKTGKVIEVLPGEVEILRKAGLLMEEKPEESEDIKKDTPEGKSKEPERIPGIPVLTHSERKGRIKQARKLKKQGLSQREIGRRLGVSHTAVQKWFR